LTEKSSKKTREGFQNFFKEKVEFHGVKSAVVAKIGRHHFRQVNKISKRKMWLVCEELLSSGLFEESMIAFAWADKLHESFEESDFSVLERWLRKFVTNWAACDALCNHAVGSFVDAFPLYVEKLKSWARSQNRWLRRAAAVTLILPARKGRFLSDIFEIADILLEDKEDLVQKGYGWMLKEASKLHQQEVFEYVVRNRSRMPRTALRYAIEKMPADFRKKAREKG